MEFIAAQLGKSQPTISRIENKPGYLHNQSITDVIYIINVYGSSYFEEVQHTVNCDQNYDIVLILHEQTDHFPVYREKMKNAFKNEIVVFFHQIDPAIEFINARQISLIICSERAHGLTFLTKLTKTRYNNFIPKIFLAEARPLYQEERQILHKTVRAKGGYYISEETAEDRLIRLSRDFLAIPL